MADDMGSGGVSGTSGLSIAASKQLFGAQVVKKTLDIMNTDPFDSSRKNADYDFQTKVLEGGFALKGDMFNKKV
ncbi:hypothetical protein [Fundidesulfovibrio agrisoli]|uniref:hypothetical protein n=1 Tax=Fundidesulfovibrio agrisoli TaxID=2922717 RepID=UPI001FABF124|nr:hypothetical protein [Fundidesulfovibrio agrisoli]